MNRPSWDMISARLFSALSFLWCLACLGALVIALSIYHVDVPSGDQLALTPDLEAWYEGTYQAKYLIRQHNEHRILIPRTVFLITAILTDWNVHIEVFTNVVVGIGIFLCWLSFIHISRSRLAPSEYCSLVALASTLTFSLSQWENWSCGWQLQVFLAQLGMMIPVAVLAGSTLNFLSISLSIAAAMLATWSFSIGALSWIFGAALLFLRRSSTYQRKGLCMWITFAALNLAIFAWGYEFPANQPSRLYALFHPIHFLKYLFTLLGAPLSFGNLAVAEPLGGLGIIAFLYIIRPFKDFVLAPPQRIFFSLALFYLSVAIIMTFGRVGYGVPQALSGRYVTLTAPFWISLAALAVMASRNTVRSSVVVYVPILLVTMNNLLILGELPGYRATLLTAQAALATDTENWDLLKGASQWPEHEIPNARRVMKQFQLSVFRRANRPDLAH